MTTHYLKCHPIPFEQVVSGTKRHEVRKADRDYKEGNRVVLREWDPHEESYSGEVTEFRIGHVTAPGTWGLPADLCVFTLLDILTRPKDSA